MGRNPNPPSTVKDRLNRGAWTAMEDRILIDYVKQNGEGKWERVLKHTGLRRCGKSCRLRWLNYLRPDIKRGNISDDEEDLIIRLHKLLGNRWSLIAGRLPGRTDNEIKNYWNSTLRKKVQSGGEQPKDPRPKKGFIVQDCVEPLMAVENRPSDQTLAASAVAPDGSAPSQSTLEAEGAAALPVGSENEGCRPWDFMVDHKPSETCLSEFFNSCLLDAGEVYTEFGPGRCENRFKEPCALPSSEDQRPSDLSEDMLSKWAAELMG